MARPNGPGSQGFAPQPPAASSPVGADPSRGKYRRDPDYGKPPQWGRLYSKFFPTHTDGCSRHVKIIAEDILRDPNSPVRRMLIDAGYEPDHWAQSLEITVKSLWETRAKLWATDPEKHQRQQDRAIAKAIKRCRDSDQSREAGETEGLDTKCASAGPKDIAQPGAPA